MHCLFTKCELHEQSKRANSQLLSSQLNAPDVRPQARCVFACLPGNTNMHPGMSWDLVSIAEVERALLWLLYCLAAKTLLAKCKRQVYITTSLKGELSPYFPGDYYYHFSGTDFRKKAELDTYLMGRRHLMQVTEKDGVQTLPSTHCLTAGAFLLCT